MSELFGGFVAWWEEIFEKDKDAEEKDIDKENEYDNVAEGSN